MTACPASDNSECCSRLLIKLLSLPHRDHSCSSLWPSSSSQLRKGLQNWLPSLSEMGWHPVSLRISKCYKTEARVLQGPLILVCEWQPQFTSVTPHQSKTVPCLSSRDVLFWAIMWPPHLRTVLIQFHNRRYSLLQQTRSKSLGAGQQCVVDHGQDLWPPWPSHSLLGS